MDKEKKEKLKSKGWKISTVTDFLGLSKEEEKLIELKLKKEVKEPNPIRELHFVRPSMWIRAYDGIWTRRQNSRERCHKCRSHINVRIVEVQIEPTDDDWKELGMEGCSVSYVPFKGYLEIHWCPYCRKVVATALDSERQDCLYDDQEEGYATTPTLVPSEAYDKAIKEKEFWQKCDFHSGNRFLELHKFIREQIERHDTQLDAIKCTCEFCTPARKLIEGNIK